MLDFYEKRKLKQLLYSKVTLVVLLLVAVALIASVWGVYQKERETRIKRAGRAEELKELEGRAASLESEIDRLSTKRGIEEEIRGKFEVAKEGEEVIVIVDAPEDKSEQTQKKRESLWSKFLSWF